MGTATNDLVTCPACGKRNRVALQVGRARCGMCHADLPRLVDADDTSFDDLVVRSKVPVLVDIWAPWCRPCRAVAPVIEALATEHAGRLKVVKVNADDAPQVSARHGVTGIPTLLIYAGGREAARTVGALPAAQLREWVESALAQAGSTPG